MHVEDDLGPVAGGRHIDAMIPVAAADFVVARMRVGDALAIGADRYAGFPIRAVGPLLNWRGQLDPERQPIVSVEAPGGRIGHVIAGKGPTVLVVWVKLCFELPLSQLQPQAVALDSILGFDARRKYAAGIGRILG